MSEENNPTATETVSESPVKETEQSSSTDQYIAESKKYRKRAQDAESRLASLEKKLQQQEESKLKEKEEFKTLYEQSSSKVEMLEANAEKWSKYEEGKRASLLEKHPEEDRESLVNLPLDTLEFVTNKINGAKANAPEMVGRTKNVVTTKPFSDMTEAERREWHKNVISNQKS